MFMCFARVKVILTLLLLLLFASLTLTISSRGMSCIIYPFSSGLVCIWHEMALMVFPEHMVITELGVSSREGKYDNKYFFEISLA